MTLSHITRLRIALLAAAPVLLATSPAFAQDADEASAQDSQEEAAPQDDYHNRGVDASGTIVVTAAGLKQLDMLAGTSVMEGSELQSNMAGQVGDVLVKLPGVSATSFAPGVSRPVLRGFSGERVKVLVDGIGAIDISNTSADHAVSIDPLTAERIEVLRGPAVMLYGSQAIGGAVNVIDKRIPQRLPTEAIHVDALAELSSVDDGRKLGASADAPIGGGFAFHVDAGWQKTGDLSIPGYAVAPELRASLLEEADASTDTEAADALREAANQRGTLLNSSTETWSANAGLAWFEGPSNFGVALGVYDTSYGVPARPGDGEEDVSIALRQYRADARGKLDLGGGFFESLNTRFGYSDYTHTEFEGAEAGTIFDVQGMEARAELVQAEHGSWSGSLGGQYYFRDFAATGEEAYIPPNTTEQGALFALQEVSAGPVDIEFAGRWEGTRVKAQSVGFARSFNSLSGAIGFAHETDSGLRFGLNLSRAQRAPSAEEMLSNGAHVATQAFEIGNPDLTTEKANGAEIFMRGRIGPATVNLAAYKSWFSGYIFEQATGEIEDGLPVFAILQSDARYQGVEGEFSMPFAQLGGFQLLADLRGDYVRANLKDGTPLPRIPPLSLLGAIEAQGDRLDLRGEVSWNAAQNRTAPYETPTGSFALVNATASWKVLQGNDNLTLMLQADNIFDVTARRAASFTKDFVPLGGRNFRVSLRASF